MGKHNDDQPTEYLGGRGGYGRGGSGAGGAGRDGSARGGAGRGSDDQPTEYFAGGDDQPTEYLDYDPDADFRAFSQVDDSTRAGNGQDYEPTRFDQQPYDQQYGAQYGSQGYGDGYGNEYGDSYGHPPQSGAYDGRNQYGQSSQSNPQRARKQVPREEKSSKSVIIIAVAAIIAAVTVTALILNFANRSDAPAPAAPPAPTMTSEEAPATTTTEQPAEEDNRNRIQEEIDNIRENPPSIPGFGDNSSGWANIPSSVVGKSPATVEAELRLQGFSDITVYNADGSQTNSAAGITKKVASIEPGEGEAVTTDTPVRIYLQ